MRKEITDLLAPFTSALVKTSEAESLYVELLLWVNHQLCGKVLLKQEEVDDVLAVLRGERSQDPR